MALPERIMPPARAPLPWSAPDASYQPGGQVGQMHADLAQRLGQPGLGWEPAAVSPGERLVRRLSVAGGYLALLGGYAAVALLLWR